MKRLQPLFSRMLIVLALSLSTVFGSAACALAQQELSEREQAAINAAIARVAPSVVKIETVGGLERVGKMLVGVGADDGPHRLVRWLHHLERV